jgi:sortase A
MPLFTTPKKPRLLILLKRRRIQVLLLSIAIMSSALYLLALAVAPMLPVYIAPNAENNDILRADNPQKINTIYIEKIGVNIPFMKGGLETLRHGAWHRFPERGDPENGGNFILSAHRFQLGLTPLNTVRKSPFYNLHKLDVGDNISITYNNRIYQYAVTEKFDVQRTAIEIEAPSSDHKLTLYSCSLKGEKAGRIVIQAKMVSSPLELE